MADVSIYVAVVTGAAGVLGAAIPQTAGAIRDGFRMRREHREQLDLERYEACIRLLRAVWELRVLAETMQEFPGDHMDTQLVDIRGRQATAELEAMGVARMVGAEFPELVKATQRLSEAASRFADAAGTNASRQPDSRDRAPLVFGELDECVMAFKAEAVKANRRDRPGAVPARDAAVTRGGRWRLPLAWRAFRN